MGFELVPHTADLKAITRAADLAGLYGAAADLVRAILVGESPVRALESRNIRGESRDPAEAYFRFVRELLYAFDADGFLPARVEWGDPVRVRGERFDPSRHRVEREVKALTRHGFRVVRGPSGYRAELVFDL
jgi:SHS2 domain-containing protein